MRRKKNNSWTIYLLLLACLINPILSTNASGQNIRKSWLKVMKACSGSEITGKNVLFFGPSNTIGLGSIWRKTGKKSYNPRFEMSELFNDSIQKQVIVYGTKTNQCVSSKNSSWDDSADAPIISGIFGMTGINVDFRKARRTTITVDSIALDVIKELDFEDALHKLREKDPQNPYLLDILNNNRLVVTKAYRLTGLKVTLDYDPKQLDSLKNKYPTGASISIGGNKGIKLSFDYKSSRELTIALPQDVYIAGELSQISQNGTINLSDKNAFPDIHLLQVKVDPDATVGTVENIKN